MMTKPEYVFDGNDFTTLEEFYDVISRVLIPGANWGRNLDALNDILSGGFGTPEGGFILRWQNSQISRDRLGYPETVRYLKRRLFLNFRSNRRAIREELEQAKNHIGPTIFDWLVEIIRIHC